VQSPSGPSEDELPRRTTSQPRSDSSLAAPARNNQREDGIALVGYHLYNVHEMVSSLGKSKKLPTTLGLNLTKGLILIAPTKDRDGPQQEWTAEKLQHYSIEGKHVFMELVRPSKSIDFHAGAKDTALEIVAMLGELAGTSRGGGLGDVIAAVGAAGQKKGIILYEFMAQGDDEVSVAVGDEIMLLDDTKSEEWWLIRRMKNGKEGVVPSSYVEITGTISAMPTASFTGSNTGRSAVDQNRLEEERLTREAAQKHRRKVSDSGGTDSDLADGLSQAKKKNDSRSSTIKKRQDTRDSTSKSSKCLTTEIVDCTILI